MLRAITSVVCRRPAMAIIRPSSLLVRPAVAAPIMVSSAVRAMAVRVVKTDDELTEAISKNADKLVIVDWTGKRQRLSLLSSFIAFSIDSLLR